MRRRLIALLGFLSLVYGLSAVALYFMQDSLIYFPHSGVADDTAELHWVENHGERIRVWKINGSESDKAIIYFGGNAEDVTRNIKDFRRELPGYTVYLVSYRGYGGSTGEPGQVAFQSDALRVFDRFGTRHRTVVAMGRSLGSGVATYLASERELAGLILVTPYDSLLSVAQAQYPMYPLSLMMRDTFRSDLLAPGLNLPNLMLIAETDRVIPSSHSLRLAELLPGRAQSVATIAQARHNNISHQAGYWETVAAFLSQL